MQRFLTILERAFTGALEEQYSNPLWQCWSHQRMGCQISVVLRGNAVLYALRRQKPLELTIGGVRVTELHNYLQNIQGLLADGGCVYALREDLDHLQIDAEELDGGVSLIQSADLARLFTEHDQVWYL